MDGERRFDKRELLIAAAEIAAAAYSFWRQRQVSALTYADAPAFDRQSATPRGPEHRQQREIQNRQHGQIAGLQSESYPKSLLHVAVSAAKAWSSHRAASKGAALALYTLFSLAPLLVLVVTIAGFFFGQDVVRQTLLEQMSALMGAQGADAIKTILAGAHHERGGVIAGLVSAALVLVSATTAFAELKDSLDELWGVSKSQTEGLWGVVRERFLSLGLILVLILMLMATLVVSSALAAMGGLWQGGNGTVLQAVTQAISDVVSFAVVTGLFAIIYKYLPATKIAWKDVVIGAVLTAVLFTIGKFAIGLYVAHANISSSYGAAGSVVILITWIYYSAQIFFYGSLFTHEYAVKLGSRQTAATGNMADAGAASATAALQ
jgi:membrane protein